MQINMTHILEAFDVWNHTEDSEYFDHEQVNELTYGKKIIRSNKYSIRLSLPPVDLVITLQVQYHRWNMLRRFYSYDWVAS